jgi:hypothetical protein
LDLIIGFRCDLNYILAILLSISRAKCVFEALRNNIFYNFAK